MDVHHGNVDPALGLVQLPDEHVAHEESAQEEEGVDGEEAGHDDLELDGSIRLERNIVQGPLLNHSKIV